MSKKDKINTNSAIWEQMWAEYEESIAGRRLRREKSKKRRKERKLEKMWKEARKKVKFPQVFIGIFMPILAFTALLCLVGTMLLYHNKNMEMQNEYFANDQVIYHELCSVYEEVYNDYMQEDDGKIDYEWISRAKWIITTGVERYKIDSEDFAVSSYILLTNKQDLSMVADSSMGFWMSISEKNTKEKKDSYMRYFTANEVLKKMAQDYDCLCDKYPNYFFEIELEDCYYKDDEMIPGKFVITDNNDMVYKEYDSTPEDTSGYIHITSKDYKFFGPVWVGNDHNDLSDELKEDTKLRDHIMIADADNGMLSASGTIQEGFDNYIYDINTITSQDETEEMRLIFLYKYNIVNLYGKNALAIYTGILALALLLSLAIAYHSYLRYQAQLQMEQYRINITNMMAHDLKSPLMVISGYAENLKNNVHVEKKDYYAQAILENVRYMDTIVHNVLDLSKLESKVKKLQKEEVSLFGITKEQIEKYQEKIMSKELKIWFYGEDKKGEPKRFTFSSKAGTQIDGNKDIDEEGKIENRTILADTLFMEQIIGNLITNAVKYTKEQGDIFITINQDYYEVRNLPVEPIDIEVKDLWKPFVKGDNSRSREQGSGIGLTIVKNIAEQQGFLLEIAKEDDGFTARIRF